MILQLNPMLPCRVVPNGLCPGGAGFAVGWIDYSQEHDLLWVVAIDSDDGEAAPWTIRSKFVRFVTNTSLGRNSSCPGVTAAL